MTPPLQRGEFVIITAEGREVEAMVALASENGRSLILMFDAILGGWAGQLPAFEHDDGQWRALNGMPLQLARREPE